MLKDKSVLIWFVMGAVGISVIFYLVQVLGMMSWSAPIGFLRDRWYYVVPLVLGFAIQVGLFRAIHLKTKKGGATVVASGGVSTTAMIACCMHNFVVFLPIIGLSGLANIFAVYQGPVFLLSIAFMAGGIIYMLNKYQKVHACCK